MSIVEAHSSTTEESTMMTARYETTRLHAIIPPIAADPRIIEA
jgi:hypothetical protein